jgi:hypothetical protein
MKCPHCLVGINYEPQLLNAGTDEDPGLTWVIETSECPECHRRILALVLGECGFYGGGAVSQIITTVSRRYVHPKSATRPVPIEVPDPIAQDYLEAAEVLAASPKASAALSRRCPDGPARGCGREALGLFERDRLVSRKVDPPRNLS